MNARREGNTNPARDADGGAGNGGAAETPSLPFLRARRGCMDDNAKPSPHKPRAPAMDTFAGQSLFHHMTPTYRIAAIAKNMVVSKNNLPPSDPEKLVKWIWENPEYDFTERIRSRLVSLTVTDNNGEESDTLRLTVENADGKLYPPVPGDMIFVRLGYSGHRLRDMGSYTVDEVRQSGPPRQIEITAHAAVFAPSAAAGAKSLNDSACRSWEEGMTIFDLVKTIAAESNLKPYVTPTAAAIVLPHLDQTDESNISFLTRLADQYNSNVKPAFGQLIFAHEADLRKGASGKPWSPPVPVNMEDVTSYDHTYKARELYTGVVATWHDRAAARQVEELVGSKEGPVKRIRGDFPDSQTARETAASVFLNLRRYGITFDFTMPAPVDMAFVAEGFVGARGFGDGIDTVWSTTAVEWNLSESGLSCAVKTEEYDPEFADAETPGDDGGEE